VTIVSADPPVPADGETPLAGFLSHIEHERRLSANTVQSYRRDIAALLDLAGTTALAQLRIHHVRRFIAQLHAGGLAGKSLARMLSSWRGFFKYLARDHGFSQNPCVGLRAPKSPKALPHALSPDGSRTVAGNRRRRPAGNA